MAYILKSDKVVNDPNGVFPILTDRGLASAELASYYNQVKSLGYALSQSEFEALKSFEESLKTMGVWGNIIEFLPMFGSSIEQQLVKMKFKSVRNATPIGGLDNTNVDAGKGVKWTTKQDSNSRAVDLGITNLQVVENNGYGLLAFFKMTTPFTGSAGLFGSRATEGDLSVTFNSTGQLFNQIFNLSQTPYLLPVADGASMLISKNNWTSGNVSTLRASWVNGNNIANVTSAHAIVIPGSSNGTYLGAVKSLTTNTGASSFLGSIRMFAIHDGGIDNSLISGLNTFMQDFVTDSGKSF